MSWTKIDGQNRRNLAEGFTSMKMLELWLKLPWFLLLRNQSTIIIIIIIYVHICMYVSLGLNGLVFHFTFSQVDITNAICCKSLFIREVGTTSMTISSSHYSDVIMGAMASQITSVSIVYAIICSDTNQRKHQSSASLAFVRGIHRGPVNSRHQRPVTRKMSPFDDVIMVVFRRMAGRYWW